MQSVRKRAGVMAVHLAVPVRASSGVDVELAPQAVHLPLEVAVLDFGREPAAAAAQVEVPEHHAPEMREVRDGRCAVTRRTEERDRADDDYEVPRRYRKQH